MDAQERENAIRAELDLVEDPEVPITLHDLGVLRDVRVDGKNVEVTMVPTRLACPGRDEMARRVRAATHEIDPDASVNIYWDMESWEPTDITAHGCGVLREAGYSPALDNEIECPYCGSGEVEREGDFGGSLCKMPYTCGSCRSTFEAVRSALLPMIS